MLSYGKIVFHLSKITRHTKCTHFHEKWEKIGILGNSFLKLNNSNTNQKIHTSCFRRADDNNSKDKTFGKVPPLSQPPPLPSLHSAQGSSTNSDLNVSSPKCGGDINSCPTTCPVYEDCAKANEGSSGSSNYMYWKQTLVVLILTGISLFVFTDWFDDKDKKKKTDALQSKTQKTVNKKPPIVPNPISSKSIPSEVPYLLIGGGTSAFSAFRSIKASDPKAKVLVITKEGDLPYMRPPLSKELWYNKDEVSPDKLNFTQWNGTRRSLFFEPPEFYLETDKLIESEKGGVAVARGWTVKKIDVTNQTVYLQDGHKIKYGKCLIASGASPKNLEIFNSADDNVKEKVMTFRAKEDYLDLLNSIQKPEVKNIVIIGGGLLGSELACSLARNVDSEKKVYQIFKEKSILAQILPKYLSEWATSQVNSEGVNLITNTEVHGCKLKNDRLSLILTNGEVVDADKVVVSIGVTANTDFAEDSLELDTERGGFLVNAELEARSNVWVSGDAACFYDVKLGRRRIEHHDHAVISGRLAGENMTGAKKPYHHQSMFWSDLGPEIGLEAIGIIDSTLETVGVFAEASEAKNVVETDSAVDNKTENKIEIKKDSKTDKNNNEELHSNNSVKEGKELSKQPASKNFDKGVVFYLRNNNVVGILLWNVFNKMSTARQVLARGTKQDEINEIAKLFAIHDD